MKEIKLTKGKVALVDDEDYDFLSQWKWYAEQKRGNWYAKRGTYFSGKKRNIFMHRVILKLSDSSILTDHIDGNGLNNQRSNLRTCTVMQNCWNSRRVSKTKKSSFKGVVYDKQKKRYRAHLSANGNTFRSKRFKTPEEAAIAYNQLASLHFGEFANLNQV